MTAIKIKLPRNAKRCPHHTRDCASVRFPVLSGCDCNTSHPTWIASDGKYGVCQMAPSHIKNCIHMLIENIRYLTTSEYNWWDWPIFIPAHVWEAEDKLKMFLKERNRRIKEGTWRVSL